MYDESQTRISSRDAAAVFLNCPSVAGPMMHVLDLRSGLLNISAQGYRCVIDQDRSLTMLPSSESVGVFTAWPSAPNP